MNYEIRSGIGEGEGEHRFHTTDKDTAVREFLAVMFQNTGSWKRMLVDGEHAETWTWIGKDQEWDVQEGCAHIDLRLPKRTPHSGERTRVGGDPHDLRAAKERGRDQMERRIDERDASGGGS